MLIVLLNALSRFTIPSPVAFDIGIKSSKNPLFDYLVGTGYQGGPVIAQFLAKDQKKIEEYLSMSEIRQLLCR